MRKFAPPRVRAFIRAEDRLPRKKRPKWRRGSSIALLVAALSLVISIISAISADLANRAEKRALLLAEFIDARDDMYEIVGETRLLLFRHEAAAKDPGISDLVRDFHKESAAAHKSLAESVEKDIGQYSAAIAKLQAPSRWIYWAGGLDDTRGSLIQQRAAFLSIKRLIQAQKTMAEIQEQHASSKDKNAPVTSAGAEGQQREESSAQ